MVSTNKVSNSTIGIPQHGTYWCIPASIENLLRAEGITDITQEDLTYEYLLSLNMKITINTSATVPLSSLQKHQVLKYFRCKPIPKASFQTFRPVANTVLNRKRNSIQLTDITGIKSSTDYVKHLKILLSQNKPVLMSAEHASGWHIIIVYEIDATTISSYDPGQNKHLVEPIDSYKFSYDVLYIQ